MRRRTISLNFGATSPPQLRPDEALRRRLSFEGNPEPVLFFEDQDCSSGGDQSPLNWELDCRNDKYSPDLNLLSSSHNRSDKLHRLH